MTSDRARELEEIWTPAEVLRAALLHSHHHNECEHCNAYERVAEAARTIALPILERDEKVVERLAAFLRVYRIQTETHRAYMLFARAALDALIPDSEPSTV